MGVEACIIISHILLVFFFKIVSQSFQGCSEMALKSVNNHVHPSCTQMRDVLADDAGDEEEGGDGRGG